MFYFFVVDCGVTSLVINEYILAYKNIGLVPSSTQLRV